MAPLQTNPAPPRTWPPDRRTATVLGGLILSMVLAALDNLIVGNALPTIVRELHGVELAAWPTTAYILTSSVSTPLYGKIGDRYGRRPVWLFALTVFLAGSALCGVAQTMDQLIVFRAVQGLGGGGLIVSALAISADLLAPRDRARFGVYLGLIMNAATVAGPLLGGALTSALGWRSVFYVNLPLGAGALVIAVTALRGRLPRARRETDGRIDWAGSVLLGGLVIAIVLLTTWGGTRYAWDSPPILALGGAALVTLVAWLAVERRATDPVIPLRLFGDPTFSLSNAITLLSSLGLFGCFVFVPMFLQRAVGLTAAASGAWMLPMAAGQVTASFVVGRLMARTGHYKWFGVGGMACCTLALLVMSTATANINLLLFGGCLLLLGAGSSAVLAVYLMSVQNNAPPADMGVASSSVTFGRQIGGSIGVALFGAVFDARLAVDGVGDAVTTAFGVGVLALLAGLVLSLFVRSIPLGTR